MKILYSIILMIAFISTINAQKNDLSWKGVTIDKSTPEDAIAKFGKPEKDETDRLDILNTKNDLFTQNVFKKEYRVLKYKEIEQATKVRFGFSKDNKLVFITFLPSAKKQKLEVQAFLKTFEITDFKAKDESLTYLLVGKQESGFILAQVIHGFAYVMSRHPKPIEDVSNDDLEGIVSTVQFISKSLESKDHTEVLK